MVGDGHRLSCFFLSLGCLVSSCLLALLFISFRFKSGLFWSISRLLDCMFVLFLLSLFCFLASICAPVCPSLPGLQDYDDDYD